jgi:polar amino acid transport system substrate-binding protein
VALHFLTAITALLLSLGLTAAPGEAASLSVLRERGTLTVCAHPDALPFSSQEGVLPGFQVEIAEAVARDLHVRLNVQWIVFTRHARRAQCDAVMGSIVQADAHAPRGSLLTKPYVGSGYVLVLPPTAADVHRLDDMPAGKVGVEHTSWPHYILTTKKIPTSSYGNQPDLLDAVSRSQVVAGFVTDAYVGWYLKQHPGAVKIASLPMPDADFRWNVAIRLLDADQALADAVSQSLDHLIADRTIPGIFAKYGITYVPPSSAEPPRSR